jgi:hypothetical protein
VTNPSPTQLIATKTEAEVNLYQAVGYDDPLCHTASIDVPIDAETVFGYVAEPTNRDEWSKSMAPRTHLGDGLYAGHWSGGDDPHYARYRVNTELLVVDASNGDDPERMFWASSIRVIPGPALGMTAESCRISLMTWRTVDDDDEFWFEMFHGYFGYLPVLKRALVKRYAKS